MEQIHYLNDGNIVLKKQIMHLDMDLVVKNKEKYFLFVKLFISGSLYIDAVFGENDR